MPLSDAGRSLRERLAQQKIDSAREALTEKERLARINEPGNYNVMAPLGRLADVQEESLETFGRALLEAAIEAFEAEGAVLTELDTKELAAEIATLVNARAASVASEFDRKAQITGLQLHPFAARITSTQASTIQKLVNELEIYRLKRHLTRQPQAAQGAAVHRDDGGGGMGHPKVFISHASEDKDRFVLKFAERLRTAGVDAWIDKWEMYPGDSLVQKIFNEGIPQADAVIAVLSAVSCTKPWVREEMDAAFVKRINQGSRLIPVVIEDCDVREALKTTLWEPIPDLNAYDEAFKRILDAITGRRDKPPLGPPPEGAASTPVTVPGLTQPDSAVLKLLGDRVIAEGSRFFFYPSLPADATTIGVSGGELEESVEILSTRMLLEGDCDNYELTHSGFDLYLRGFLPGYDALYKRICLAIVNEGLSENRTISEALGACPSNRAGRGRAPGPHSGYGKDVPTVRP